MYRQLLRPALLLVPALWLGACSDQPLSAPSPQPEPAAASRVQADAGALRELAHALSMGLQSADARARLVEDLRDSPFAKHGIHARSYLRGPRGSALLEESARASGVSAARLLQLLEAAPTTEILVPRPYDRATWKGTADVTVVASPHPLAEVTRTAELPGFAVGGREVAVNPESPPQGAFLLLAPSGTRYGSDPEAVRRKAPRRQGSTISTRDEEMTIMSLPPEDCTTGCEPAPTYHGYSLGYSYSWSACMAPAAGADPDQDGFTDACEAQLAYHFRPRMIMNDADAAPSRESYWSARPNPGSGAVLEIFYLLGYHRDPGEVNTGTYAHDGDSEFVILRIREVSSGYWMLENATLSAHFKAFNDRTTTYGYSSLQYVNNYRGRPDVWAARNKHANYPSQSACDGSWGTITDTCDGGTWGSDFNIAVASRNIGNRYYLPGITQQLIQQTTSVQGHPGQEWFWGATRFGGWKGTSSDADGYIYSLEFFGF